MKHFRVLSLVVVVLMLIAACTPAVTPAPASPAVVEETSVPEPMPTQAPTEPEPTSAPDVSESENPGAVEQAIAALAQLLGIAPDQIKLVSVEGVDWPDGCLGVQQWGVMCAQAITPGFKVVLEANGVPFEYHTNHDGSALAVVGLEGDPNANPAVQAAIKQLAEALGITADAVTLVSAVPVQWPTTCLGIEMPNMACGQMITPGMLVVLEANGTQYRYHTDESGSQVMTATVGLTWQREGGIAGFCDNLTVYLPGTAYAASCGGPNSPKGEPVQLSAEEAGQLAQLLAKFGQVTVTLKDDAVADGMSTELKLFGQGTAEPSEADQQQMMQLAQSIYEKMLQ